MERYAVLKRERDRVDSMERYTVLKREREREREREKERAKRNDLNSFEVVLAVLLRRIEMSQQKNSPKV